MIDQPPQPQNQPEQKERISLRILVADDQDIVRQPVVKFLERSGHTVVALEDGQEIIDKLKEPGATYDIVISDNNMKKKNGIVTLREIRFSGQSWSTIPFILLTGIPSQEIKEEVEDFGGVMLEKPLNIQQLANTIKQLTEDK